MRAAPHVLALAPFTCSPLLAIERKELSLARTGTYASFARVNLTPPAPPTPFAAMTGATATLIPTTSCPGRVPKTTWVTTKRRSATGLSTLITAPQRCARCPRTQRRRPPWKTGGTRAQCKFIVDRARKNAPRIITLTPNPHSTWTLTKTGRIPGGPWEVSLTCSTTTPA